VRVNSARNDDFVACVNRYVGFHFERFADDGNRFVFD